MENKKQNIYRVVMLIIITIIVTFMVTSIGMYNYFTKISKETKDVVTRFETVKSYLEEYYIGDLDIESMNEMAIKGYVAGVNNEYTEFLTKDEYEDLLINVTGDYVGIGIYMYQETNGDVVVLLPMEGSPAKEADLQPNDIITAVDGKSTENMTVDEVAAMIKGEAGTTIELEVKRGEEILKKTIERRKVEIPDSTSEILENNIGYIQLATFDEGCSVKVANYLKDFEDQNIKSVIIDLRDNTGGIVDEAINLSELFIEKGNIIMRTYNKKYNETIYKSENKNPIDMNIVLLVNENSASATEIVTAALKDNKAATIVGTTTYGKGVMQEVVPLFEGALKVTIEEFKTPNGDKIQKKGITPDVIIEDDIQTLEDEQLQKAVEILK